MYVPLIFERAFCAKAEMSIILLKQYSPVNTIVTIINIDLTQNHYNYV